MTNYVYNYSTFTNKSQALLGHIQPPSAPPDIPCTDMAYEHLAVEERELLQERLWEKKSVRSIARELGRSHTSLLREIARNKPPLRTQYTPRVAEERAREKRKSRGRKLRLKNQKVRRYVVAQLKAGYSPEQVAGRMTIDIGESLSHEAIYQYVYATTHRGEPKRGYPDLRKYLKRRHKKRTKKGMRKGQRVLRPMGISIDVRPPIVERRSRIGDWEGDTVESKNHGPGLNTLVERKTGLVLITKVADKTARATTDAVVERLAALPRHTLTLDNGKENQYWQELEKALGISVFFAHPYHSWERGTNENTNGLIRWYFPKGTDFRTISDESIRAVEVALNNRPRKRLGWKTPLEAFSGALTC